MCFTLLFASVWLASVDVVAAVARLITAATWSLLMLPPQSRGSQRLPGRCWSCRCSRLVDHSSYLVAVVAVIWVLSAVDHSSYLVAVVAVILVLSVDALPPRLRLLSGQPLR